MTFRLEGLVAATHTPFASDGALDLSRVERQAEHLLRDGVKAAFVAGTTGESHSLTADERLALAARWSEVVRGTELKLVVHVGSNTLADSRAFAAQAQQIGADAIAAVAPSYFKPKSLGDLIACCEFIAGAAPEVPFYHYDIPPLTGVSFPMDKFLERAAEAVPTLVGVKYSNPDLAEYQRCLHASGGRFDVPWGIDEYLLAAMVLGGRGAVGSSYNFAAPLYHRLIAAFERGDLAAAREEQYLSVRLITLLAGFGYMASAKATMRFLGVEVGRARLPNANLDAEARGRLRAGLEEVGFFDRVRR